MGRETRRQCTVPRTHAGPFLVDGKRVRELPATQAETGRRNWPRDPDGKPGSKILAGPRPGIGCCGTDQFRRADVPLARGAERGRKAPPRLQGRRQWSAHPLEDHRVLRQYAARCACTLQAEGRVDLPRTVCRAPPRRRRPILGGEVGCEGCGRVLGPGVFGRADLVDVSTSEARAANGRPFDGTASPPPRRGSRGVLLPEATSTRERDLPEDGSS